MKLTSPAFEDGQEMDQKYGEKNENISIPLSWSDVPAGTKSFALTIVDHHPVAQDYVHWMVTDINGQATGLEEGASIRTNGRMPAGSKELVPYAGPFPPSGTHAYEITLYAIKSETLSLLPNVDLNTFTEAAQQNALASATLTGNFTRL